MVGTNMVENCVTDGYKILCKKFSFLNALNMLFNCSVQEKISNFLFTSRNLIRMNIDASKLSNLSTQELWNYKLFIEA